MFSFVDVLPTLLDAVKADDVIPTNIQGHSLMAVMRGEVHRHREIVFGDLDYLGGHYPSRAVRSRQYKYIYNEPVDEDYGQESIANASWWSMLKLARGNDEIAARVEKLLRRPREELYDLERDPGELHNLLAGEDHEAQRAELAHQLRCWMEETGDSLSLPADVAAPTPCRPAARGGLGLR